MLFNNKIIKIPNGYQNINYNWEQLVCKLHKTFCLNTFRNLTDFTEYEFENFPTDSLMVQEHETY